MKTHKPKISFNTSPDTRAEVIREEHDAGVDLREQVVAPQEHDGEVAPQEYASEAVHPEGDDAAAPQTNEDIADGWLSEAFEPAAAPKPAAETVRDDGFDRAEWEKRLTARPPEPTPLPMPKPTLQNARLAALGQIGVSEPSFFERNGGLLGVAAVVGCTFVLGLGSAIWFFKGDESSVSEQATFSAPLEAPVFATGEADAELATRALTPDMTDVSTGVREATATQPTDLTSAVLAGLQQPTAAPEQAQSSAVRLNREALEILSSNKVRMLREGVLADIYYIETYEKNGSERVRLRTINASLVDEYTSGILLDALAAGQIEMSKSLMTPEGEVDVETMMFNLVQTSLRNDHSKESVDAALGMSRKIFAASVARTQNEGGARVYRVQAGDSLAYIALQFLGSPTAYKRIFEANRSTLQSPEQIQIGQRLIIPS